MAPRLLRLEIAKQWISNASNTRIRSTNSATIPTVSSCWSPREMLAGHDSFFPPSSSLTVKQSLTSRFFMYEEHGSTKLEDNEKTQVLQVSPLELAELLHGDKQGDHDHHQQQRHCYWTSPVVDVAPGLLKHRLEGYESLHDHCHPDMLDPRGPSLWMGTNGSSTQAHYDVADNVIVQLFGTKRIRCYSPKAATALHVFPDAHPRARKSQVNFDDPDYERFQNFSSLPIPVLDVVLTPGDAIRIPAFWFHHVENGRSTTAAEVLEDQQDGPSVSANVFALSSSMIKAQGIFRDASRPLGLLSPAPNPHTETIGHASSEQQQEYEFAVAALHALGFGLIEGLVQRLGMEFAHSTPQKFIQDLLDTRYAPLLRQHGAGSSATKKQFHQSLTISEQEQLTRCIERILPQFASLLELEDENGVVSLVACHLLELWAVEFVGAPSLVDAWQAALLLGD